MSFPYYADLSFGSEKATADSLGRTSFGTSGGGTKIPTTEEELNALIDSGKAIDLGKNLDETMIADTYIWETSEDSNILGFVAVISGSNDPVTIQGVYEEEAGEAGAYEFTQPFGEGGSGKVFVIYK